MSSTQAVVCVAMLYSSVPVRAGYRHITGPRFPASVWTSSDEAQSLFEQMSLCPKLIHSQADSFTVEFYPSRGVCGYALLLSSGNVPVTGALPDLGCGSTRSGRPDASFATNATLATQADSFSS